MFSDLNVAQAFSTIHIVLYEEIPINQSTITVWTFPLLVQCWTEGHMSLKKIKENRKRDICSAMYAISSSFIDNNPFENNSESSQIK